MNLMYFVISTFKKGQKMSRILLTTLASVAFSFSAGAQVLANPETTDSHHSAPHHAHHGADQHHKMHHEKPTAEMIAEFETRLGKVKEGGASLSDDLKGQLEYNLKIAAVEIETLKDPRIKDHKKHVASLNRGLGASESIIKKHEHMTDQAKKMEDRKAGQDKKAAERKAKEDERKARAEDRKAKAEARKAEREAAKAKRVADKGEKAAAVHHEAHKTDHANTDGADKAAHDKAAHDKAAHDKAAHDKAAHDKAAHDKAAHEGTHTSEAEKPMVEDKK
jgi:hypothetical protein